MVLPARLVTLDKLGTFLHNMSKEGIISMSDEIKAFKNIISENKTILKHTYNVENIGIFGSFATGKNKETSDVDILVELSKPVGMFKFIELEEYLSQLLGKKVDLATKKALKPAIKDEILQQVIYV